MTQIGIESQNFDADPAVQIWHELIKVPEMVIQKAGELVLGQE